MPAEATLPESTRGLGRHAPAVLLVLALAAHGLSLRSEFISDDFTLIVTNPLVTEGGHWREILTTDYFDNPLRAIFYRPAVIAGFRLDAALGERWVGHPWPFLFHLTNLLLHMANTLLVLAVLRRLMGERSAAALAAGLFAVHPLLTEAVGCVFARTELLAAFGQLLALWCWLRGREARRRVPWMLGHLLAVALAMLSKESAVCLPGIILAEGLIRRRAGREVALWIGVGSAAILLCLLWRVHLFGAVAANPQRPEILALINPAAPLPWGRRVIVGFHLLTVSLGKFVWPATLSLDHSFNQIPTDIRPALILGALFGFAVAAGAAREVLVRPTAALWPEALRLGAAWFLVTWILVGNLVYPVSTIFAERLLYFPSIGLCLGAGWLADRGRRAMSAHGKQRLAALIIGAVAILAVSRAVRRHADLRDNTTALIVTAQTSPRSAKALADAAGAHMEIAMLGAGDARERLEEAHALVTEALAIYPDLLAAWLSLAQIEQARGNWAASREALERARDLAGGDQRAQRLIMRMLAVPSP